MLCTGQNRKPMLRWVVALCAAGVAAGRELRVSHHMALSVGDAVYDVTDPEFGAAGDGVTDDTAAVQRALDACRASRGGTVRLPRGRAFLVYSVNVTVSRTVLSVEGALVLGDRATFYATTGNASAVIRVGYGEAEVTDVAIAGGGTVDGRGAAWWPHRDDYRPHMVETKNTRRLLIHDVTFLNPPSHCLELSAAWVELSRVNVLAPPSTDVALESHNTDAYDVHGVYAYVHDVNFTTGDDDLAFHANHTLVERSARRRRRRDEPPKTSDFAREFGPRL